MKHLRSQKQKYKLNYKPKNLIQTINCELNLIPFNKRSNVRKRERERKKSHDINM